MKKQELSDFEKDEIAQKIYIKAFKARRIWWILHYTTVTILLYWIFFFDYIVEYNDIWFPYNEHKWW